ncbi:MAG: LuxR C-terminal-related transcriptional regulator [Thermomicrobiales bacterium]
MLEHQPPDQREFTPHLLTSPPTAFPSFGTPIPRPLNPLIARDAEVAAVVDALMDPGVRLLTLTGPGGVGKTRLAIACATALATEYADGAVFVDLAPVLHESLVLNTIAAALKVRDRGTDSLKAQVLATVADRHVLIVLDNFEHVVVAAPRLFNLFDACPHVKLLVTSRIRLRLSGEREISVNPLTIDVVDERDDQMPSGAVRLFYERARAIDPAFDPDDEAMATVEAIVRRVDGLPLAIELAAARTKALPPVALLQRLEQRLPVLRGGARDLPLRQQTMRDTIRWSYDLLDDTERTLFRQLGVFVGGFTLAAAEAIAPAAPGIGSDASPPWEDGVLEGIQALIEHSLLRQTAGSEIEPRYRMLETVREYARDHLLSSNDVTTLHQRHADYFLAYAAEGAPELAGPVDDQWVLQIEREMDNLRAAIAWAVDQGNRALAMELGAVLWRYWEHRGYLAEAGSQLDRILALGAPKPRSRAHCSVTTGAAVLAAQRGDYERADTLAADSLGGWEDMGDPEGIGRALLCSSTIARYRDDYPRAQRLGETSLQEFEKTGNAWGCGHALTHLGMIAWVQGDHVLGTSHFERALAALRQVHDDAGIFDVVLELGKGTSDRGDLDQAAAHFEECLILAVHMGDEARRGATLGELGVVALRKGDAGQARELFAEAMALAKVHRDERQVAYLDTHLADIDVATGALADAANHYLAALERFVRMGNQVGVAQCAHGLAQCAMGTGHVEVAVQLLGSSMHLFAATGAMPPPERDPDRDAESLKPHLSPEAFLAALEAGRQAEPSALLAIARALAAAIPAHERDEPSRIEPDGASTGPDLTSNDDVPATTTSAATFGLTPREVDVLRLLAEGMSDRQIAEALSISERTAGNHVQHAMQKIDVDSRTAAAVFAVRNLLD